jgi:hypothetical protein
LLDESTFFLRIISMRISKIAEAALLSMSHQQVVVRSWTVEDYSPLEVE